MFDECRWLPRRRPRLVGVLMVVAALMAVPATAAAAEPRVGGFAASTFHDIAQVDDGSGGQSVTESQAESGDGTRPVRLAAIAMGTLGVLLSGLTWFYWKATTPPARRGYVPEELTYRH